ncbi:hypothetical protein AcV7_007571 [Taiwanofungus camphoratus]|nr:hypothetical protein AcV7_007571 [Antrodia cinnamomea]
MGTLPRGVYIKLEIMIVFVTSSMRCSEYSIGAVCMLFELSLLSSSMLTGERRWATMAQSCLQKFNRILHMSLGLPLEKRSSERPTSYCIPFFVIPLSDLLCAFAPLLCKSMKLPNTYHK